MSSSFPAQVPANHSTPDIRNGGPSVRFLTTEEIQRRLNDERLDLSAEIVLQMLQDSAQRLSNPDACELPSAAEIAAPDRNGTVLSAEQTMALLELSAERMTAQEYQKSADVSTAAAGNPG